MGVHGLLSFASKHQCGLLVPSLRAVTADGPRVLVVDGAALLYSFARTAELGMAQALCGGEYPVLVREVQSFVARLRAVALEPVVFFDGVPEAIKRRTHLARRREEVSALGRLFARINADVAYGAPYQPDGWVPPLLAKETLLRTLAELHVQCHQAPSEADCCVAAYYVSHQPRVYAVLSNDSDFLIYPVRFIPFDTLRAVAGGDVSAVVFEPLSTAAFLGLVPAQLPLLACLVGNDYTRAQLVAAGDFYALLSARSGVRALKAEASPHTIIRQAAGFIVRHIGQCVAPDRMIAVVLAQLLHRKHPSAQRRWRVLLAEALQKFEPVSRPPPALPPLAWEAAYASGALDCALMSALTTREFWCRIAPHCESDDVLYLLSRPIRLALYAHLLLGHASVTEFFQCGARFVQEVVAVPPPPLDGGPVSATHLVLGSCGASPGELAAAHALVAVWSPQRELVALALRYAVAANAAAEEAFLFEWEPLVLAAHAVCMEFAVAPPRATDDPSPVLGKKQLRLLLKIPLGRTVALAALYQSLLWHCLLAQQVCGGVNERGLHVERLVCGSQLNNLYHAFYRFIMEQRSQGDGPWCGRVSGRAFAAEFVRVQVLGRHPEALAWFEILFDFMSSGGLLDGARFRCHFPDDFPAAHRGASKKPQHHEQRKAPAVDVSLAMMSTNSFAALRFAKGCGADDEN